MSTPSPWSFFTRKSPDDFDPVHHSRRSRTCFGLTWDRPETAKNELNAEGFPTGSRVCAAVVLIEQEPANPFDVEAHFDGYTPPPGVRRAGVVGSYRTATRARQEAHLLVRDAQPA